MKIAFIITAYKLPAHIDRMISLMNHESFYFFIHLDKKINIENFQFLTKRKNVFFVKKRSKIIWASFTIAQAVIDSLEEAKSFSNFDRYVLMSGQDFPLMTPEEFLKLLYLNPTTEYIKAIPYDLNHEWWKKFAPRVDTFSFINWNFRGNTRLAQLINFFISKRKHPKNIIIAGNENWFCLTSGCVENMLSQFKKNKELIRFLKMTWGSDEYLFSTLVYNSPYRDNTKPHLTFVDWPEDGIGHPTILGKEHFEKLIHSEKFLARKFDPDYDNEILNMLENHIKEKIELENKHKNEQVNQL